MPLWHWRGYDAGGLRQGHSLRASREDFIASWRGSGQHIVLTELRRVSKGAVSVRAKGAPLARLTRLLALMLQADIPVATALEQLVEQGEGRWSFLMAAIAEDLEAGCGLHDAFAHRQVFSPFYLAVLRAVEEGAQRGHLLSLLADVLERDAAFARRLLSALLYPAILLLAGLGAVWLMVSWVVPSMRPLLGEAGELPALTAALLGLSDAVLGWHPGRQEVVIAALLGMLWYRCRAGISLWLERLPMVRQARLARAAAILTALQAGQVQVVSALHIVAASSGALLGGAFARAVSQVERGVPLSSALQAQRQLPLLWSRLMRAGEVSGDYGRSFQMLQTLHSKELERQQALVERLAEPVLIAIIGAVLTLVLLGLYLPILRAGTAF